MDKRKENKGMTMLGMMDKISKIAKEMFGDKMTDIKTNGKMKTIKEGEGLVQIISDQSSFIFGKLKNEPISINYEMTCVLNRKENGDPKNGDYKTFYVTHNHVNLYLTLGEKEFYRIEFIFSLDEEYITREISNRFDNDKEKLTLIPACPPEENKEGENWEGDIRWLFNRILLLLIP